MTKEFNSIEEIEQYYDKKTNAYIFKENGRYIDVVVFNFNLDIKADIYACNIMARDISAYDITAYDINAYNIFALDINYYSICFAYDSIRCKSISSIMANAQHFVLNGVLEIEE